MIRSIIGWSLRFRILVVAVGVALIVVGFAQLRQTPVEVLPEFTPPYVEIQTEALGLSAVEVEQLITVPLEADLLHGVAFLDEIHSQSVPGLSSIVLLFDPGTNVLRARQLVAERLTQAFALPNVSKPSEMLQPLASTSRVLMVGLSSKDVSLIDMSVLAHWTIRPRLMSVPGVANVAVWGQRDRQLQVLVDPKRLQAQGVSLSQIIETAGNALWVSPLTFLDASTPGTGGFIDTPNQRLTVQHILPIRSAEDLAKVAVEPGETPAASAQRLRLGDVATVVEDHQPLIGDALVNDGPGLYLVVEAFAGANTLEVTRGVEAALDALRPGLSGIQIDKAIYRPATYIETAVGNVELALVVSFALVVVVLLALLRSWRAALVGIVAIPLSLAAAGLVLFLLGGTLNAMVAAGLILALAVAIDDAVVGTEKLARRLREPRPGDELKSKSAIVLDVFAEGRSAIIYATLIVVLALVPLFFVAAPTGPFLPPFAFAYGLAVFASMVVALTVAPALALTILPGRLGQPRRLAVVERFQQAYETAVSRTIQRARPVLAVVGVLTIVGVVTVGAAAAPQLTQSPVPTVKDRDLLIEWDGAPGTSLPEMNRIVGQASRELRALPGVRSVGAHVGRAVSADQVVGINSAELWVSVDPAAEYDRTVSAIQGVIDGYPGLHRAVLTYPGERINEVLGNQAQDIVVRVYGQDLEILKTKAEEVRGVLAGVQGVLDPAVEPQIEEPAVEIEVDLAAAQQYGVKAGDVRRAATTLLSGIGVGSLFEEQKVFDVVVWGTPEIRQNLSSIRDLLIEAPGGRLVRLGDVADVRIAPSPSVVRREGVMRRIDVGAGLNGRDVGAVIRDIESRLKEISFPLEYHAEVLGSAAQRQGALIQSLGIVSAVAIGIFLLLQAAFGVWRLAVLVLLALPAALMGGAVGAFATGGMTLGALLGFFAVLAIATRQAITLIERYQRLERADGKTFNAELIVRGARERLTPILGTALATGAAFLPFVAIGDVAGFELSGPMAAVILGGLVTATLVNLFVVPALCMISAPSYEPDPAAQLTEQPGLSPA